MAVTKEIVAIVGKYTDKQGNEKNQYQNIGKIIETASGKHMVKIDCIPIGWDGWAYMNDPKPRDNQQSNQNGNDAPFDVDSIPF